MLNKPKAENILVKISSQSSGDEYEDLQTDIDSIQDNITNIHSNISTIQTNISDIRQTKQDNLTFDTTPTENSSNPVISSGIKSFVETHVTNSLTKPQIITDSSEPSFEVESNTIYQCTAGLTSLTLTSIPNTQDEALIYFYASSSFTVGIPSGTRYINDLVTISGYYYVISILNGVLIIAPCSVRG
jgi:hypothetical protein